MFCLLKRLFKYFLYVVISVIGLAATFVVYLIWFQPPFYFPKPTGQYAVGAKDYHWIDTKRKETLADDPAYPNRELMVKIWYPAQGKLIDKPTTPYAPSLVAHLKKNKKLLWLLGLSRPAFSWTQHDAPLVLSNFPLPVIIFSHGRGDSNQESHTAQCEELASHGYVVVAINHTYGSILTAFPDGRVIDGMTAAHKRTTGLTTFMQRKKMYDNEVEIWASDVQFVIDQLETLVSDEKSMLFQRLDQNNIGMFGHSLGGATAIQCCRRNARIKAGVNLDGGLFGKDAAKAFDKPCMFMLDEDFAKTDEKPLPKSLCDDFKISSPEEEKIFKSLALSIPELAQAIGNDTYTFVFKDTGHMDFSDIALLKHASLFLRLFGNLGSKSMQGTINGFRATEIVNAYLVNFFDKYLKGKPSQLLDGKERRYAEVEKR